MDVILAHTWQCRKRGLLHIADPGSPDYPVSLCKIQLTNRPDHRLQGPPGAADCERCKRIYRATAEAADA